MNRTDVINLLAKKIGAKNYLEIGVRHGENFHRINCPYKVGVDPDPNSAATHFMTSDDFFATNNDIFDIVFVDGLHIHEQVHMDILNSLAVLSPNGYIVCHDMNPPTEQLQSRNNPGRGNWNGDCWKALVELRFFRPDLEVYTVDTDWGCGVITRGSQETLPGQIDYSWDALVQNRKQWLNLISESEFIAKL